MSTVLERLRSETRAQHEAMEALFALPVDRAAHVRWLKGFFGFLDPLEQRMAAVLPLDHPLWVDRRKSVWLHQDLVDLKVDPTAVPRTQALPDVGSVARCVGALYVFEGATLGGQVIARHLESALGLTDGVGYRYYRGFGPATARRWQDFRALVSTYTAPETEDQTVAAAGETFTTLRTWCASVA